MKNCIDILWDIHNNPSAGFEQSLLEPDQVPGFPTDLQSGQRLQLQLLERWLTHGKALGGWKIGMTSGASRNAMGTGIRPFGFILQDRIKTSADTLSVKELHRGQIENELCFRIGKSLGAGTTPADAKASVASILPAFEINQKRLLADAPAPLRIADNLSNWGIVIGEPVAPHEALEKMTVTLSDEHKIIEALASQGHIDDHFQSLATLANHLGQYNHALQPGQYVITGAYGKTPFAPGTFRGHFDCGIGDVTTHLA